MRVLATCIKLQQKPRDALSNHFNNASACRQTVRGLTSFTTLQHETNGQTITNSRENPTCEQAVRGLTTRTAVWKKTTPHLHTRTAPHALKIRFIVGLQSNSLSWKNIMTASHTEMSPALRLFAREKESLQHLTQKKGPLQPLARSSNSSYATLVMIT